MKEITQQQILDAAYEYVSEDTHSTDYNRRRNAFIDAAKWAIDQMQPEWLLFKEIHPEAPGEYSVSDGVTVSTMKYLGSGKWGIETPIGLMPVEILKHTKLTHWMPLPDAPKQ